MRVAIATLLAVLAAPAAWATCTSPAVGTLEDIMAQATWTEATGSNWHTRTAHMRIALPAGASMKADDEGNAGAASYAGLAADATAEFAIQVASAAHNGEVRRERGWLRVQARNPDESPGVYRARASGSPVWLYPVSVTIGVI